jgi:hypothetical protein
MLRNGLIGMIAVLLLVCPMTAQRGVTAFYRLEDDFLHYNGHGSDRYYTGGMALGISTVKYKSGIQWNRWLIQQRVFTPTDITKPEVQYRDYPYAGLLYGEFSHARIDSTGKFGCSYRMGIGASGKNSLAAPFQKEFHRWIDYKRPMGWDHVVEAGIVCQLEGTAFARIANDPWASWFGFGTAEAGTIFSSLTAGTSIQFGYGGGHLPVHFFPGMSAKTSKKWRFYAFFVPRLSWIIKNKILSQGLLANPLVINGEEGISISPFVLQTSTGLYLDVFPVSLRLAQHYNTKEFAKARPHTFGEISLFYSW